MQYNVFYSLQIYTFCLYLCIKFEKKIQNNIFSVCHAGVLRNTPLSSL